MLTSDNQEYQVSKICLNYILKECKFISPKFLLRFTTQNIAYTETLAEIIKSFSAYGGIILG